MNRTDVAVVAPRRFHEGAAAESRPSDKGAAAAPRSLRKGAAAAPRRLGNGASVALQRHRNGAAAALRDETGSTLPLVTFYAFLCLVVVLLAVAATSLYLERERLFAAADGAALAGAEAYDLDAATVIDGRPRPTLESREVGDAVADYLGSAAGGGFDSLVIERADTEDGRSATVRLSAVWHPPVVSMLVPAGLRIAVTSSARSVFR